MLLEGLLWACSPPHTGYHWYDGRAVIMQRHGGVLTLCSVVNIPTHIGSTRLTTSYIVLVTLIHYKISILRWWMYWGVVLSVGL